MNVHWGYLVQRIFSVVRFNSQVLSYWNHDCLLFMTGLFVIGQENLFIAHQCYGRICCCGCAQRLNMKDDKESICLFLVEIADWFFVMGQFMMNQDSFYSPLLSWAHFGVVDAPKYWKWKMLRNAFFWFLVCDFFISFILTFRFIKLKSGILMWCR